MTKKSHRLRKIILITLGIIIGLIALVIGFLSPIVKYVVEKYDEKYTGRQITMDWAYVNPFTGYVHFDGVKFFEQNSDSVFFSSDGISLGFDMRKLLSKEYEIKYLLFDKPYGIVVQHTKTTFNFTDLITKFSKKKEVQPEEDSPKLKFSLLNVEINEGAFYLREEMTPINYFIKHVNITSSGLRWNADTILTKFTFESGIGTGTAEGIMRLNTKSSAYNTHVIVRRLDLKIIEQYVRDMASYGTFTAMINADITADGNLKDARNVDMVGGIGIYNFHFGKTINDDVAAFDKFVIKINRLNPQKKIYLIDSISLVHPVARYEKYDHLDNIQYIFGKKGAKVKEAAQSDKFNLVIEIARYIKLLAKNFFQSNYKINRLGIYRADLQYEDYSINERFAASLNPLTVTGDSMNSNKPRVVLKLKSGIKPYGDLDVKLSINPKDSSDFELNVDLEKVNAAALNPYLVTMTSFPLDRGSIHLKGNWRVRHGEIKSTNHLLVIDPRLSTRVRANDNKWLPLRLIMFFVRERGNAIDYEIPITGNLRDPKFHFKDVIYDVLTNVFVKPPTTPYRFEIRNIENTIENTLTFDWELGSTEPGDRQDFIDHVVTFLKENPAASINVHPINYAEKEKEYIAFFEAKKKYYLATVKKGDKTLSPGDSTEVSQRSAKDSLFVHHMRSHLKDEMMYTVQQLCAAYAGPDPIDRKYRALVKEREGIFMSKFREEGVDARVIFSAAENRVPFNGFSYYRISYKGQIPEEMKKAFEELNEYDNEVPRKKLKEERRKTRRFINAKSK